MLKSPVRAKGVRERNDGHVQLQSTQATSAGAPKPVNLAKGDLAFIRRAEELGQLPHAGDLIHLATTDNQVTDMAVYVSLYSEEKAGVVIGINVHMDENAVLLAWSDVLEFWRTPTVRLCALFAEEMGNEYETRVARFRTSTARRHLARRGKPVLPIILDFLRAALRATPTGLEHLRTSWAWLLFDITGETPRFETQSQLLYWIERRVCRPEWTHPEKSPDEAYLGNFRSDDFRIVGWHGKRLGKQAYDDDGVLLAKQGDERPMFVSRREISYSDDGELRTMLQRRGWW